MGCEAAYSFKQLGSPEDAILNQHLHSHLKGGIIYDEGTTYLPLALAVHSWKGTQVE